MKIDTSIYKAYDIRGTYPTSINEEVVYKTAKAYAQLMMSENKGKDLTIALGYDMRLSTPSLKKQAQKGLLEMGVNVVDIGMVTTPTFYFAVGHYGYDGGLQVTASHNPKDDNGLKMVRANGVPVSGEKGIYEIRDMVVKDKFEKAGKNGILSENKNVYRDIVKVQIKETKIDTSMIKPFKIVVDTANGMAILDIDVMFKDLPCKLTKLFAELDGKFPNHEADPLKPENSKWLKEKVLEVGADFGIITDGDGDRYFFVDEKGEEIRNEILRGIMAQISLKDNPGAPVCYDIRPGKITKDMIEEAGGEAVVTRVGHSLIKEKMLEIGAPYGGESSGHFFYKFSFGTFEAPVVYVLKLLRFLSEQNKPFSEVVKPYKKYFHSGEINSDVKDKEVKLKGIAEKFKDAKDISHLDGVTIEYDDYWFNVRPSNTENKLRLNLEAVSKDVMEKRRDEVLKFIRSK